MNFYKHHLGDYDGATAHLSWDEDMAYTRLLRAYYRREKGFGDAEEACRLIRAVSKAQRNAVAAVLGEFFDQQDDGWHNKRADEEIGEFLAGADEREEKAAHETDRMKRHRERRKLLFDTLRERGIVPPWNAPITELQRLCNAPATRTDAEQNAPATATRTTNQNHEPEPVKNRSPTGSRFDLQELPDDWKSYCQTERPDLNSASVFIDFRDYWISVAGAKGRKADWLATWRGWVRRQTVSERKNGSAPWWVSDAGIEAKARELGMWPPRGGESWQQLKGRINEKLGAQ